MKTRTFEVHFTNGTTDVVTARDYSAWPHPGGGLTVGFFNLTREPNKSEPEGKKESVALLTDVMRIYNRTREAKAPKSKQQGRKK